MLGKRESGIEALRHGRFDVVVIGGGMTGVGVALDAAARGLRVALVDRGDIASGTSSWSTKLIHGGVRYLEQLDFAMVREGLRERHTLLRIAPHLVRRLSFLYPVRPGLIGRAYIDAGLWLYDLLAGGRAIGLHQRVGSPEEAIGVPLKAPWDRGGFSYYDSQTDDTRLALSVLLTAMERGAVAATYTEVTGLLKNEQGRLIGVRVRDTRAVGEAGLEFEVRARAVINATGIWMNRIQALDGDDLQAEVVPSKGSHIVIRHERLPIKGAIIMPETSDGRVLFAVPWQGRVVIGTTDRAYQGDLNRPVAADEEIDFILSNVNTYLPTPLQRSDVIATYAGLRPLIRPRSATAANGHAAGGQAVDTKDLSRNHIVLTSRSGLVTIGGGKLTTYRLMAHDAVEAMLAATGIAAPRRADTTRLPLSGAPGYQALRRNVVALAAHYAVAPAAAGALLDRYGSHAIAVLEIVAARPELARPIVPDLDYLLAEAVYCARHELVTTLDDLLARRMRLNLLDERHGVGVAHEIADLVAPDLGWGAAQVADEVARYTAFAETARVGGHPPEVAEQPPVAVPG